MPKKSMHSANIHCDHVNAVIAGSDIQTKYLPACRRFVVLQSMGLFQYIYSSL
jgi:hypothetical protein